MCMCNHNVDAVVRNEKDIGPEMAKTNKQLILPVPVLNSYLGAGL